ncbi:MAG: hypothetical protein PF440_04160 [Thiomicrorhabdus sp.]|nr:hypothetical protein [Thiomicrorhabdus sp.]
MQITTDTNTGTIRAPIFAPIDLTNITLQMQIREDVTSDTVILDLTIEGHITKIDALNGDIRIEIPASVTQEFTFTTAVYDLEMHHFDGYVERILEGTLVLSLEVTR